MLFFWLILPALICGALGYVVNRWRVVPVVFVVVHLVSVPFETNPPDIGWLLVSLAAATLPAAAAAAGIALRRRGDGSDLRVG